MSLSFRRARTQVLYEGYVGISSPSDFDIKTKLDAFKNYSLTGDNVIELREELKKDSFDYYYNGLISLLEGLSSASKKRYSWATIKLYYSIFYFLRASFASKDYCLMRAKSMYRLKLSSNEKVFSTGNKRYNSTHSGTINHYCDVYPNEVLLTNNIDFNGDEVNIYKWMENIREVVNYRACSFYEPSFLDFWDIINRLVENRLFNDIIEKIINDPLSYCFQEEYAVIAIPLARYKYTTKDFDTYSSMPHFVDKKINFLTELFPECNYFEQAIKELR